TFLTDGRGRCFNAVAEAVHCEKKEIADLLIARGAGADINKPTQFGHSCLSVAIERKNNDIAEGLVQAGAFVNHPTAKEGLTPLQYAAREGRTDSVKLLIALGAIVDVFHEKKGMT